MAGLAAEDRPRAVVALQPRLRGGLTRGIPPAAIDVYGPVLDDGESALLSTDISYSRYRGSSARYSPLPLIVGAARP